LGLCRAQIAKFPPASAGLSSARTGQNRPHICFPSALIECRCVRCTREQHRCLPSALPHTPFSRILSLTPLTAQAWLSCVVSGVRARDSHRRSGRPAPLGCLARLLAPHAQGGGGGGHHPLPGRAAAVALVRAAGRREQVSFCRYRFSATGD
jgi:hypothetical protein